MRNHDGNKHKHLAEPWRNRTEPLEKTAAGRLSRAEPWRNHAEPWRNQTQARSKTMPEPRRTDRKTLLQAIRAARSPGGTAEPCGTMTEPNRSTWASCGKAMSLWLFHVWANRAEPSGTMTEPSYSVELVLAWLSQNRPELLLHHLLIKILKKRRCGSLRRRAKPGEPDFALEF